MKRHFVNEDLVTGLDEPARDFLALMIDPPGLYSEVAKKRVARGKHCIARLFCHDGGEREEIQIGGFTQIQDCLILRGGYVDVVAPKPDELKYTGEKVRRRVSVEVPTIPNSVGCIDPVGILKGCRK